MGPLTMRPNLSLKPDPACRAFRSLSTFCYLRSAPRRRRGRLPLSVRWLMKIGSSFAATFAFLCSIYGFAQVDLQPRSRPTHRINWEDIREELAFDQKYAPKDGFGYKTALYFLKKTDGTLSSSSGMVLYLRSEFDEKRSPEGAIIAAYEFDEDGVRLVNQFRFKYTTKSVIDGPWVFVLKGIGQTGVTVQ